MDTEDPRLPPSGPVPGGENGHAPAAAGPANPKMARRPEPRPTWWRRNPRLRPGQRYPGMSFGQSDPGMAQQQADPATAAQRADPGAPIQAAAPRAKVLGTTLRRLRNMSRQARGTGPPGRRRLAGTLVVVACLLVAGAVTAVLSRPAGVPPGSRAAAAKNAVSAGGVGSAAAARTAAAAWVGHQVSRAAIVACDPAMCAALQAAGIPPSNLLALSSAAADPLGSTVIVATPALQSQFGPRLATVYAPEVIASFGSGASRVDIRVTGPDDAAAYRAAVAADLTARRATGKVLLGNSRITASAAARRDLAAGSVDSRLLITLATLAAGQYVRIAAFGDATPGAGLDMPLRSAELTIPPLARNPGAYLQSVLVFLRAQNAPFRAASARVTRVGGKAALQIEFSAPSPLGLLSLAPGGTPRQ